MKKSKTLALFILILVVAVLAITLSSCNEETSRTLTIMNALRDYRKVIELAEEKYPELDIEIDAYRGRNQSAYMKQQLETGVMPDIYSTTQAWDEKYQKENLLDLTNYAVTSSYNTARLSKYLVDGAIYLLPYDYTITGITYNKTLLNENNIAVPTSFEQLKNETIPALKSKGINVSVTLLDLPGSGFNYFFNVSSTIFMNNTEGKQWREMFSDINSDTFASDNEDLKKCIAYFQEWLDIGMFSYEEGISTSSSKLEAKFKEGNTAFMIGSVTRYTENNDGTGDQYGLMPYLSPDGTQNTYITTPGRLYGLSKELGKKGNEQKLQDALHFLEVMSTQEGYNAIVGTTSSNLCSIKNFEIGESAKYYKDAYDAVSLGHSMDLIYVGWDDYLKPFGNTVIEWIKGSEGTSGTATLKALDDQKRYLKDNGTPYFGEAVEEFDTIEAATLTGQIFMDATGTDAALVSYNVYNPEIHPNLENSYGTNGKILKGKLTEEYITIWLATGWSEHIFTVKKTGAVIKEMANKGTDTRKTGYYYPYVYMTADGKDLDDNQEYTVVLVGHNRAERDTIGLIDTGIVGLEAAKTYLKNKNTISLKTIDKSLVISSSLSQSHER